jgi:hypothetical protein
MVKSKFRQIVRSIRLAGCVAMLQLYRLIDAKLAQELGHVKPFIVVFPAECRQGVELLNRSFSS